MLVLAMVEVIVLFGDLSGVLADVIIGVVLPCITVDVLRCVGVNVNIFTAVMTALGRAAPAPVEAFIC